MALNLTIRMNANNDRVTVGSSEGVVDVDRSELSGFQKKELRKMVRGAFEAGYVPRRKRRRLKRQMQKAA